MVFDPSLYIDDVKTPLSQTMQAATVIWRYGKKTISYNNVAYDDWGGSYGEPDEKLLKIKQSGRTKAPDA